MNLIRTLFLVSAVCLSSSAFALVDGQLLIGKGSAKYEVDGDSSNATSTDYKLAVHLDPIPFVPVAFGLYYIGQNYEMDTDGDVLALDEYTGSQIGVEIMAWIPLNIKGLEPYAKIGYSFFGNYSGTVDKADHGTFTVKEEYDFKLTGIRYGIGLRWNFIPLLAALVELNMANETLKLDELRFDGTKVDFDNVDDITVTSTAISIGLEVGI